MTNHYDPYEPPSREVLADMRESGMSQRQIGEHYGVSTSTVSRWLVTRGLKEGGGWYGRKTFSYTQIRTAWRKMGTKTGVARELGITIERARRELYRLSEDDLDMADRATLDDRDEVCELPEGIEVEEYREDGQYQHPWWSFLNDRPFHEVIQDLRKYGKVALLNWKRKKT